MLNKIAKNYCRNQIYNMDGTLVYIDMLGSTTISFVGKESFYAYGTGMRKLDLL
jgi:hypothetical protein